MTRGKNNLNQLLYSETILFSHNSHFICFILRLVMSVSYIPNTKISSLFSLLFFPNGTKKNHQIPSSSLQLWNHAKEVSTWRECNEGSEQFSLKLPFLFHFSMQIHLIRIQKIFGKNSHHHLPIHPRRTKSKTAKRQQHTNHFHFSMNPTVVSMLQHI